MATQAENREAEISRIAENLKKKKGKPEEHLSEILKLSGNPELAELCEDNLKVSYKGK